MQMIEGDYRHNLMETPGKVFPGGRQVVERVLYDAYGKSTLYNVAWSATQASTLYNNEVLYAGYRLDTESGLYQVRYRHYHPTLGRWIQRDPIRYHAGMNLYAYVSGRPTASVDPLGLQESVYSKCCKDKKDTATVWGEDEMTLGSADDPGGEANPSNNIKDRIKILRALGDAVGLAAEWLKMMKDPLDVNAPMFNTAKKKAKDTAEANCKATCKQWECQDSGDNCEGDTQNGRWNNPSRTQKGKGIAAQSDRYEIKGDDFKYIVRISYTVDCVCSCKPGVIKKMKAAVSDAIREAENDLRKAENDLRNRIGVP